MIPRAALASYPSLPQVGGSNCTNSTQWFAQVEVSYTAESIDSQVVASFRVQDTLGTEPSASQSAPSQLLTGLAVAMAGIIVVLAAVLFIVVKKNKQLASARRDTLYVQLE